MPWRKRTAPVPTSEVRFEISPEAAAVGHRAGHLWIWPHGRSACTTAEPPGEPRRWTTHRQAGFVVHVDEAIVPPERWVVTLPQKAGRRLNARWNGRGRPKLVDQRSLYRRVFDGVSLPRVVLGALAMAGLVGWRFYHLWTTIAFLLALLLVAVVWVWRRISRVGASAS